MCNDKNEDDESGDGQGDQGNRGASLTSRSTNRPRRTQTDTPRSQTNIPRDDTRAEKLKSASTRIAEGYIPSLNDLRPFKKIGTRYTVGFFGGKWFLFENKRCIGRYDTLEEAEKNVPDDWEEESSPPGPKI